MGSSFQLHCKLRASLLDDRVMCADWRLGATSPLGSGCLQVRKQVDILRMLKQTAMRNRKDASRAS